MLSNKRRLPGDLCFLATSGQEVTVTASKTTVSVLGGGRSSGDLEQSLCAGGRSPGDQTQTGCSKTAAQELSGGADLLAAADSAQPHLLAHLIKPSLHIQGCRNRDREASWLRPNATPCQAVGPSAQKQATRKWKVSTLP